MNSRPSGDGGWGEMGPLFGVARGPTVFSAAMDKLLPTLSRPTMAGIEYRHTAAGFFLTDYPG